MRQVRFSTARIALLVSFAAAYVTLDAAAQQSAKIMGINGTWERYPGLSAGLGAADAGQQQRPAPPAAIPTPPLKPEYLSAWREARQRDADLTRQGVPPPNSGSACLPQGMPGMMMAMFPMEVLETPGQVTFIQEAFNQVRRVHLDGELIAPEDAEPRFSGHSVGHWDGDTLVVETVGVKDYAQFNGAPHSMNMRITERIRLINESYMENVVTVTDPEYLTEPWTWTWMYKRWPDYEIQEYVCEDNRYADPASGYQRLRIDN
jgi:hypothetical protein